MKLPSISNIPLSYIQSVVKIDASSPSGLTWLTRTNVTNVTNAWNTRCANKKAGNKHINKENGYQSWQIYITYNGKPKNLRCSRVIFLLQNGYLNTCKEVDHIDGNSLNNNPLNLRESNRFQNSYNSKISKINTSGHKGVYWNKENDKWKVKICKNGKQYFFGYYVNKDDAIKVAIKARKKLHGTFGRNK